MLPVDFRKKDRCGTEPCPRRHRETLMLRAARANKAIGHYWFEHDPLRAYRRETKLLGGRYWVESSWNYDGTKREYLAVAADPHGGVGYLHGAQRFATLVEAVAVINAILDGREVGA